MNQRKGKAATLTPIEAREPETNALRARLQLSGESDTGQAELSVWTGPFGSETLVSRVLLDASGVRSEAGGGAGSSVHVNVDGSASLIGANGGVEIASDGTVTP